jgi:hypothetical protein
MKLLFVGWGENFKETLWLDKMRNKITKLKKYLGGAVYALLTQNPMMQSLDSIYGKANVFLQ